MKRNINLIGAATGMTGVLAIHSPFATAAPHGMAAVMAGMAILGLAMVLGMRNGKSGQADGQVNADGN